MAQNPGVSLGGFLVGFFGKYIIGFVAVAIGELFVFGAWHRKRQTDCVSK